MTICDPYSKVWATPSIDTVAPSSESGAITRLDMKSTDFVVVYLCLTNTGRQELVDRCVVLFGNGPAMSGDDLVEELSRQLAPVGLHNRRSAEPEPKTRAHPVDELHMAEKPRYFGRVDVRPARRRARTALEVPVRPECRQNRIACDHRWNGGRGLTHCRSCRRSSIAAVASPISQAFGLSSTAGENRREQIH